MLDEEPKRTEIVSEWATIQDLRACGLPYDGFGIYLASPTGSRLPKVRAADSKG